MSFLFKVLLDENFPTKLKYRFENNLFLVSTVRDQKWLGKKNGELLKLMTENGFIILVSSDKNLVYQQNSQKHKIIVLRLNVPSNRYDDLLPIVPQITQCLVEVGIKIQAGGFPQLLEMIDI
jgi:predicted nuclease of predicted toxin-antitoxin system